VTREGELGGLELLAIRFAVSDEVPGVRGLPNRLCERDQGSTGVRCCPFEVILEDLRGFVAVTLDAVVARAVCCCLLELDGGMLGLLVVRVDP